MNFRTPIVAYEEKGHRVAIFSTPPCVIVHVDDIELGPFFENMAAARKGATRDIDAKVKVATDEKAKKERKRG